MSGAWWVDRTIHADGWEIEVGVRERILFTWTPDEARDFLARWPQEDDDLRDAILDACREPDLCARHGCTRYATDGGLCALDADEAGVA